MGIDNKEDFTIEFPRVAAQNVFILHSVDDSFVKFIYPEKATRFWVLNISHSGMYPQGGGGDSAHHWHGRT